MTTHRTTIAGALDRLEVDPGNDVELDDVVYGLVRLRVVSDTDKLTVDDEVRTVALRATDLAVVLEESPLLTAIKRGITSRAAERDRAAGKPPLELEGETTDGPVDEDLAAALDELDELEEELTGGRTDEPAGANDLAPDDEPGPFEDPDGELELEDDVEVGLAELERLNEEARAKATGDAPLVVEHRSSTDEEDTVAEVDSVRNDARYLAVDGRTITADELEASRARVIAAFGTDYVDEPSTAVREDLLGLEHVAAFLLRDMRVVEQAAGARPEVLEYLDGRLATTLERYATEDPWKGYRSATVGTIAGHLERVRPEEEEAGNWPELAEHVRAFELAGKNRKGVLDVVDTLLEVIPEAELPEPDPDFEPTEDPAGDEADR